MSAAADLHTDNILIGSGELFLGEPGADGAAAGERYLGDAVSAALSVSTERVHVFSGSGAAARRLVSRPRAVMRAFTAVLHDISMENLALFAGAPAPAAAPDAAVRATGAAAQKIVARRGRWYQLGASSARPAGVRAVQAGAKTGLHGDAAGVIVTTAAAAPSARNTRDRAGNYAVDYGRARLFVLSGAADIADGDTLYVHYTPVAAPRRRQASAGGAREARAALRYIEDTRTGRGRNFHAPLCSVTAAGDFALMARDAEQRIALRADILDPGGGRAALIIDEQAR